LPSRSSEIITPAAHETKSAGQMIYGQEKAGRAAYGEANSCGGLFEILSRPLTAIDCRKTTARQAERAVH
jgi:hypothetical protein